MAGAGRVADEILTDELVIDDRQAQFSGYWTEIRQYVDTDDTIPNDFKKVPSGYYRVMPMTLGGWRRCWVTRLSCS